MNVLFLCTGNSCRSILAEAVFNHLSPPGWGAMSVASHPTGEVHPRSLALLAREEIPTQGLRSKSWDNLPATAEIIIKRCRRNMSRLPRCRLSRTLGCSRPGQGNRHAGTDRTRIEAFLALPLAQLQRDRVGLKAELDRIGTLMPQTFSFHGGSQ